MPIAIATKKYTKTPTKQPFQPHTVPLGNGVNFPVNDEDELLFVMWMIERAKAGEVSLPKSVDVPPKPDLSDTPQDFDFWAFYDDCRTDRF
ncbi:hypothetical protein AGMMS49938_00660 [Fibrobacterales bacterium]|nr:hypothetical protein AGMMS49938_00660 [Fibrobacterales bacterium]